MYILIRKHLQILKSIITSAIRNVFILRAKWPSNLHTHSNFPRDHLTDDAFPTPIYIGLDRGPHKWFFGAQFALHAVMDIPTYYVNISACSWSHAQNGKLKSFIILRRADLF